MLQVFNAVPVWQNKERKIKRNQTTTVLQDLLRVCVGGGWTARHFTKTTTKREGNRKLSKTSSRFQCARPIKPTKVTKRKSISFDQRKKGKQAIFSKHKFKRTLYLYLSIPDSPNAQSKRTTSDHTHRLLFFNRLILKLAAKTHKQVKVNKDEAIILHILRLLLYIRRKSHEYSL